MTSKQGLHRMNKLHRTRDNHLTDVVRVLDENIPKYRQINYDSMREIINERKVVGSQALQRVSKLQQESHIMREQAELKVLRECWLNEQYKLNHQSKKSDQEHQNWLTEAFHDTDLLTLFHEITRYRIWLDENAIQFRKTTVLPMVQFKEDLQSNQISTDNIPNVLDALQIVKKEQQQLIDILTDEQRQIEDELKQVQQELDEEEEINMIQEGIPQRVIDLACPDEELRATMLQEFLIIDHRYRENLVDLDAQYLSVVDVENGGWNLDEHEMLVHLYEMYPVDLKKRRTCIYDHFHRYFPSRSRQEMLNHEEWCNARNYYLKHKRMIMKQARSALELKTQSIFADAFDLQERLAQQKEEKSKQRALCEQLAQQVAKWRDKQFEVLEMRRKIEESQRQAELERLQEENERYQKHRQETKEKLTEYHSKKEQERFNENEKEQRRLEELQCHLAEQKRKDWDRIEFRQEEYQRKREEFHQRTEANEQEHLQREERLQALADRVRPHHIDIDHARVLQPTKAFNAHRGLLTTTNDEINIQQPLFPINTFNDRKLYGDIRIRLEQRLRDAGLIQTDYARQALAALQQAPKRIDTQQNQMWSGFALNQWKRTHEIFRDLSNEILLVIQFFYGSEN